IAPRPLRGITKPRRSRREVESAALEAARGGTIEQGSRICAKFQSHLRCPRGIRDGILVRVRRSWHDCVRLAETEELPRIIYGLSFVRIAQAGGQRDALGQGASHLPEAGRRAGLDVRFQNVSELLSRQA